MTDRKLLSPDRSAGIAADAVKLTLELLGHIAAQDAEIEELRMRNCGKLGYDLDVAMAEIARLKAQLGWPVKKEA